MTFESENVFAQSRREFGPVRCVCEDDQQRSIGRAESTDTVHVSVADSATDDSVGQDNLWSNSAGCHEDVDVDVHKPVVTAGHVDLAADEHWLCMWIILLLIIIIIIRRLIRRRNMSIKSLQGRR